MRCIKMLVTSYFDLIMTKRKEPMNQSLTTILLVDGCIIVEISVRCG